MKLLPTYLFFQLFRLFLHFKQYLWGITPRFVQRFIGFLFIEEAVQSVAWVPGQVLINCPPPPSTIFRELVKNCLGFCCFVTIKDLPLGFFWVKNSIGTISPGGVWGGGAPLTCRPLSSWSWRRRRRRLRQKVASMRLKIRQRVA